MTQFNYDGISFYYEDDNNGGIPFVFLHGLGGDSNQTLSVMKETPGIRRIALDFRGHGKTVSFNFSEKFSFSQFSKDVINLMNYLQIKKIIVGGISTGAGVALHMTLNYPERIKRMILSRPAWLDKPQEKNIREAFKKIDEILQDDLIKDKKNAFKKTTIYQQMNNLAKYAGSTLLGQFDYIYAKETSKKLIEIPNDCPNDDREEWRTINIPTLILISKQDPIHPYEYGEVLNKYIPESKLREITPKEISSEEHNNDSYNYISTFIQNNSDL